MNVFLYFDYQRGEYRRQHLNNSMCVHGPSSAMTNFIECLYSVEVEYKHTTHVFVLFRVTLILEGHVDAVKYILASRISGLYICGIGIKDERDE